LGEQIKDVKEPAFRLTEKPRAAPDQKKLGELGDPPKALQFVIQLTYDAPLLETIAPIAKG